MISRTLSKALRTAFKLSCPRCGERSLFRGAFTMNATCRACGLAFEREPGYFVGAIYINYTATAILMVSGFLLLDAYTTISLTAQILLWSAVGIAFPLFFYRYSKSLWLAFDHLVNPEEPSLRPVRGGRH